MVESESRLNRQLHSSWADEVEKEEEEAQAQAQLQQKQKPNLLDLQDLEKFFFKRKELIGENSISIFNKIPPQEAPSENSRKEILPDAKLEFNILAARNKLPLFVPPLRFPPKNVVAYNLYDFDNGQQDFHPQSISKPNGIQRSHCHEQRLQKLKKNGSKVESAPLAGKG